MGNHEALKFWERQVIEALFYLDTVDIVYVVAPSQSEKKSNKEEK